MRALVLGGSVTGRAAVQLLGRLGYAVTVYDEMPLDPRDVAPAAMVTGAWSDELLDAVDLVVTSPGFKPSSPPIMAARARRVPLWGDIELAMRHLHVPFVAVTGTNGKTTVVEMIAAILSAEGMRAPAAGNIGEPPADLVGEDIDALVLEVSSFQLFYSETFHPPVAVLLNVAPDHLDWHGSMEDYVAAKARIFRRQQPDDTLVYSVDDAGARSLVGEARGRLVGVSGHEAPAGGAGPAGDGFVLPTGRIPLRELAADDPIFLVDFAAAAVAAHCLGAGHEAIRRTGRSFQPGHHRRTLVGTWDGVKWVNDSKASNPHAAVAAIAAYPSVVLIAGGRNKGLDLSPLAAVSTVRYIVAIGEAADELLAAAGAVPHARASTMREAVHIADTVARPGDTVLLSPGCASFDMFSSYGERGDVFTAEVKARKEAA